MTKCILAMVRGLESHKVTMLQSVDVFRGTATKFLQSRGISQIPGIGEGNMLSKGDCERLFSHLVVKNILSERYETTPQNFVNAYIQVFGSL
jgi:superfamily II DNA helicase RecQ